MNVSTLSSTLTATLTSAIVSATATYLVPTGSASPTPIPTGRPTSHKPFDGPTGRGGGGYDTRGELLCDWIRSASDCRDAAFIRNLLIASSAMHGFVFLFGFWLLVYRNRGLNGKIISELFVKVGTGVRPKPMDCIIFFTGLASLIKVGVNLPLIFDAFSDMLWLRIAFEQTYWVVVAIGFSSYFVGLLYAMPVTTREGIFAVYQPETVFDAIPLRPIHVLTPTTVQKNFLLLMGAIYPTIFGAGAGVASAVFAQMPGYESLSKILLIVQYSNWVLILWAMAVMFFYYGLKYTFILRANIIIAEAALRAPRAAFGISNLRSSSPARFLFIQLQITGFGGSAVTLLAGSLCLIWVICREKILRMADDRLPHTMAFFWTCAIAAAYFIIMALIAVQSVRNRRRGLHEPATSLTHSFLPNSGQKSSPAGTKSMYSAQQKTRPSQAESEAHLAQRNSADMSTLHSVSSVEKEPYGSLSFELLDQNHEPPATVAAMIEASHRMEHDAFSVSHQANKLEQGRVRKTSLGSPARPFLIKPHHTGESVDSNATFGQNAAYNGKVHPDLRHSVFGSQPTRATSPPPPSSTTSSPCSPSFPLTSRRSSSRHATSRHGPSPSVGQTSHISSSHTASSNSHTVSSAGTSYAPTPDGYLTNTLGQGGDPLSSYRDAETSQRSITIQHHDQHGSYEQEPYQTLQYQGSGKGLSPPPRAKRLANAPRVTESPLILPPSGIISPPAATASPISPSRNTFMHNSPIPEYSHTPRVGGGVRRKSIKDVNEFVFEQEPKWPLPPTLS